MSTPLLKFVQLTLKFEIQLKRKDGGKEELLTQLIL